jgi:beta-mannosidase
MYPHRIRLHGPWDFEPLTRTGVHADGTIDALPGPIPATGRMKIPAVWLGTPLAGFRGKVRWRRRFHAPRTLESHEQLWIVFDGVDYFANVSLNGTPLGTHQGYFDPFAFHLESLVRPNNELIVQVDCPAELDPASPWMMRGALQARAPDFVAGLWRDVALEVRSFAYLADVTVHTALDGTTGHVSVQGRAHGAIESSVELDLSVNGVGADRRKLLASPDGSHFTMHAAVNNAELWWPVGLGRAALYAVRLEMHGAARTLDCVQRNVGFRDFVYNPSPPEAMINGRIVPAQVVEVESPNDPLFTNPTSFPASHNGANNQRAPLTILRAPGRILAPIAYDWADSHGCLLMLEAPWHARQHETREPDCTMLVERQREIVRQSKAMEQLLGHHPSIAVWES